METLIHYYRLNCDVARKSSQEHQEYNFTSQIQNVTCENCNSLINKSITQNLNPMAHHKDKEIPTSEKIEEAYTKRIEYILNEGFTFSKSEPTFRNPRNTYQITNSVITIMGAGFFNTIDEAIKVINALKK